MRAQLRFDCGYNRVCQFVLQIEDVFQCSIPLACPDMGAAGGLDQLRRDPQPIATSAHGALHDIPRAQFPAVLAALQSIGALPAVLPESLLPIASAHVTNTRGEVTGAVFVPGHEVVA